jgi:hypothetical protein
VNDPVNAVDPDGKVGIPFAALGVIIRVVNDSLGGPSWISKTGNILIGIGLIQGGIDLVGGGAASCATGVGAIWGVPLVIIGTTTAVIGSTAVITNILEIILEREVVDDIWIL